LQVCCGYDWSGSSRSVPAHANPRTAASKYAWCPFKI
jgi:hypothetical protein